MEANNTQITKNFSSSEFRCHCGCGWVNINYELVRQIQRFRDLLQFRTGVEIPITINSGCRCEKHNKAVGGKPNSYHVKGMAADIQFKAPEFWNRTNVALTAAAIAQSAVKLGLLKVGGIGAYPEDNFIHLDIRPTEKQITWIRENGVYRYGEDFQESIKLMADELHQLGNVTIGGCS
jgi:hypothetical protein